MMKLAMCLTAIMLTYCIALSSAASLPLPEISLSSGNPPPIPPKALPSMTDDGPPMYQDIDDEYQRHRIAVQWCVRYHYMQPMSQDEIDALSLDDMKRILDQPLRKVKLFYQLQPVDGELTNDVLSEMSSPRCSDNDNDDVGSRRKRFSELGYSRWKKFPVTITFENFLSQFTRAQQMNIARHCGNLWGSNSGISFKVLPENSARGNIYIQFKYIDGAWSTVGQALSPNPGRGSYLYLDNSEKWKLHKEGSGYGVSLTWAMCHEMGHNLGLGHSNDRNAIMYPSGTGQDVDKLLYDDLNGVRSLYPGNSQVRATPTPNRAPAPTPYRAPTPTPYRAPTPTPYRAPSPTPYRAPAPVYRAPSPRYYRPPTVRTTRRYYTRPSYPAPSPRTTSYRSPNYAPPGHIPNYRPNSLASVDLPPVKTKRAAVDSFEQWLMK